MENIDNKEKNESSKRDENSDLLASTPSTSQSYAREENLSPENQVSQPSISKTNQPAPQVKIPGANQEIGVVVPFQRRRTEKVGEEGKERASTSSATTSQTPKAKLTLDQRLERAENQYDQKTRVYSEKLGIQQEAHKGEEGLTRFQFSATKSWEIKNAKDEAKEAELRFKNLKQQVAQRNQDEKAQKFEEEKQAEKKRLEQEKKEFQEARQQFDEEIAQKIEEIGEEINREKGVIAQKIEEIGEEINRDREVIRSDALEEAKEILKAEQQKAKEENLKLERAIYDLEPGSVEELVYNMCYPLSDSSSENENEESEFVSDSNLPEVVEANLKTPTFQLVDPTPPLSSPAKESIFLRGMIFLFFVGVLGGGLGFHVTKWVSERKKNHIGRKENDVSVAKKEEK